MAVVSVAIIMSFHLKSKPSATGKCPEGGAQVFLLANAAHLEKKFSLPLGVIFWILSVICLVSGLANYIQTVAKYSRREALVQAGWKTQTVFTVVASTIVAACILFLATNAQMQR